MREKSRWLLAPVLGAAVAAGALVATASPAAAAVPGHELVNRSSGTNSNDFRRVTASCPSGKVLIGTGYRVTGAAGEVVVDDVLPNGTTTTAPTSVRVDAYEADGFDGNWTLHAEAVCANVAGAVRVAATRPGNSNDFHDTPPATCPSGKTLTGTGFEMDGAFGEAVVDDLRPNGSATTAPTSVTAGAYEAEPIAGNWTLIAYGICTNPLPGLVRVTDPGSDGDFFSQAATNCPTGVVNTGGGFEINGALGEALVTGLNPTIGSNVVTAYEEDPIASVWTVTAYGICATA